MSSNKRASLSSNSPLDQLFRPAPEREARKEVQEPVPERPDGDPSRPRTSPEAATSTPPNAASAAAESEEAQQEERELRQTTIMIYDDQSDWLDETCYLARRENGSIISKAAILRALVDMAREDEGVRKALRERLGIGD